MVFYSTTGFPENTIPVTTLIQRSNCILAENLTFRYPERSKPALGSVSFGISSGERVTLMGPNGCGKSTLAKLLAGLIAPTSGVLQIFGQDLQAASASYRRADKVGIVFQSPDDQMVASTVEREIAFGLENMGIESGLIRAKVDALMDGFDLRKFARRSPHHLSGGEKQRVALASVLVMEPKLLILDEVTSLLDPVGRSDVLNMISKLKSEITVFLITQFPKEALIGGRLMIMSRGQIIADASPEDVFMESAIQKQSDIGVPLVYRLLKEAECSQDPSFRK